MAWPGLPGAQCVPGREYQQSEAVKSRYPDPPVRFDTPGFAPGKTGFTSHEEMMRFVQALARRSDVMRVRTIGESQEGRALPLLVFSDAGDATPSALRRLNRPIVFLVGQVHGNEPAGGEAMLALAQSLAEGELKPLLDRVTVVILPRANPDGAHYFWRATANCVDVNRDHVKVDLPETVARRRPPTTTSRTLRRCPRIQRRHALDEKFGMLPVLRLTPNTRLTPMFRRR